MKVYVDVGVGNKLPKEVDISKNETVGSFRRKYADELGVPLNNAQIVSDLGTEFSNDRAKLSSLLQEEETIHITPRAKGG